MTDRPSRDEVGRRGEEVAAQHLEALGLHILCRNFHASAGERLPPAQPKP